MFRHVIIVALLIGSVNQAAFAEEPENPWLQMKPIAPAAGMPMKLFIELRGEPDRRELLNGAEVFWYDVSEPYYAVFKNKKLISYYIDKDTIARRNEEFRRQQEAGEHAQYEAQAREQEYEERRKQHLLKIIGNSFKPQPVPYQIPVRKSTTTNCYPGVGGSVQCTSY
jgi:hypothetical protein